MNEVPTLEPDCEDPPGAPSIMMSDDEVAGTTFEYSTRAPTDWVISGPLPTGAGPGRVFSWAAAEKWARAKYGKKFKGRIAAAAKSRLDDSEMQGGGRWAFLIKKIEVAA